MKDIKTVFYIRISWLEIVFGYNNCKIYEFVDDVDAKAGKDDGKGDG